MFQQILSLKFRTFFTTTMRPEFVGLSLHVVCQLALLFYLLTNNCLVCRLIPPSVLIILFVALLSVFVSSSLYYKSKTVLGLPNINCLLMLNTHSANNCLENILVYEVHGRRFTNRILPKQYYLILVISV